MTPEDVTLENLEPAAIAKAWQAGDLDAAFVWNPTLGELKQSGKVLLTAGTLARWGKATFDGLLARDDFIEANADFMCQFILTIAAADEAYRTDPEAFDAESRNAKMMAALVGGAPEEVPKELELYEFPTLEQQASKTWLGGGAASTLAVISRFLKEQGVLKEARDDYSASVTADYVNAVINGC